MAIEYGLDIRHGRVFGIGTLIGDNNDAFFKKDVAYQVAELGWSNGCPRREEVVRQYGLDWTRSRYAETNFWFKYIYKLAEVVNLTLYDQLVQVKSRLPGEPVGKHEPQSVPQSHLEQIYPMSGLYGYALPRVLIEQIGQGDNRSQPRLLRALGILEEIVADSATPGELLARLADQATSADADPRATLSHILPAGILDEENCKATINKFASDLQTHTPALWALYKNLTFQEKEGLSLTLPQS